MSADFAVVCWRWKTAKPYRTEFGPETVNVLRRMVARHYPKPHRFICLTDDPAGIDKGIEVLPIFTDFTHLPSPHGRDNPSCYRRLRMFSRDAGALFGPRFVSMDLDTVITGDLRPLFDRPEEIVLYGDTNPATPYNGSMILMTAGSRTKVWDEFDPETSPAYARKLGYYGSDQAWISACLGPNEPKFTRRDGVYSFRNEIGWDGILPFNARMVMMHGQHSPWEQEVQIFDWVRNNYV